MTKKEKNGKELYKKEPTIIELLEYSEEEYKEYKRGYMARQYEHEKEKIKHSYSKCDFCRLNYDEEFIKKTEAVLKNSEKSAVEKKMEIFDILLEMDFGELSASEKERANVLLKSHFYGELAKKYLKEYKEATAKEFSNN